MAEPTARSYDATCRRARADQLTDHILDTVLKMVEGLDAPDISLEAAAQASGVSVPTLVRRFASKDGLYAAAFAHARTRYRPVRELAESGDSASAIVEAQLAIYERWGRALLYLRTQEGTWPVVQKELETGRRERRIWLARVLVEPLGRAKDHDDALGKAFALTDVHLWAVFRLDLKMSRKRTARAMCDLLRGFITQVSGEPVCTPMK